MLGRGEAVTASPGSTPGQCSSPACVPVADHQPTVSVLLPNGGHSVRAHAVVVASETCRIMMFTTWCMSRLFPSLLSPHCMPQAIQ